MARTATPRSATVTSVAGFDQVPAPDGVQAGDMLVAIITSTGSVDDIDIQGGAPWTQQDELDLTLASRVFTQVAGSTNPTTYGVEAGTGSGTCTMLHLRGATPNQLLLVSDSGNFADPEGGVPCPDASPGVAGGVELRYAVGYNETLDIIWEFGKYPIEDQAVDTFNGGGSGISAYVGARTMLSSTDLPAKPIHPLFALVPGWQSWTIVVTPGDYVPPPPPVPAFTQGKGNALYRYTAHDFMTGQYKDDLYPRDVTYDKRIGEPGSFSGTLPIPNTRVAAAVRRVIPRLKGDLTTGPGRIEIRIWRDGELRGRYWLTGARLSRGRDGKITVALRGSTLDAYWFSVRVRDTRDYAGDQVANVRSLLQHAQAQPGAFSGVAFQAGTSGVDRPLKATKENGTSYGRAAAEYAKTDGGFEHTINETVGETGVESTWVWGYPKLGGGTTHVYTESPHGGEIADWGLDLDALQGGTDWESRGGTPETDATENRAPIYSTMVTTPHRAAGWPRIDHLIDHPGQSLDQGTLDDFAQYWADRAGGALWVRTVTVFLGKTPSLTMNSLGDNARLVMSNVWFERTEDGGAGLDISERIIAISIKTPQKGFGIEEATLILESEATA